MAKKNTGGKYAAKKNTGGKNAAKKNVAAKSSPKNNKGRIIAGLVLGVILLALLGGATWFILNRTNGGTEDFRTFTVTLDGKELTSTKNKRGLLRGEHSVEIGYLFDFVTGETYDYNVDIVPRTGIRFNYTVDGKTYPWSDQKELAKAFALKKDETGFTFTVPGNLAAVFGALYPGAAVEAPREIDLDDAVIYSLVVSSYNNKMTYTIDFYIDVPAEDLEVTPGEVIFPS